MLKYEEVRSLHIEISSNCNARCVLCPRNFHGYPINLGYQETSLSLEDIKHIFSQQFIKQIEFVYFNGNFGDFMLAPESVEIVEYFIYVNPKIKIYISTNGSARDHEYWYRLGSYKNVKVAFCLDGWADTHSLYRIDTNWNKILSNAKSFISAGRGLAKWKMIKFDHNQHQIEDCRKLSQELGFYEFELVDHGRNQGTAYNRNGSFSHDIGFRDRGKYKDVHKEIDDVKKHYPGNTGWEGVGCSKIDCEMMKDKSIYVSANGDVSPCCYLGLAAKTYDTRFVWGNEQVKALAENEEINALKTPLKDCMKWFNKVEESWSKSDFSQGKLWRCDAHCGVKNY